ncbi:3-deoxy-D-manno-octulosonic acid kinase [Pseudoalteromonas sp. JBTF-M23]|uniref:3-deoxy-D-manno-octulosonic acid kinase n=1 Tax=Pseudoalteromonas caenipelagi TaxID=2726988 RepID=A0A849VKR4_9GAMM|nr:3-deoxy-D-manno-octulosonic acid kinase [Pseudoalteromonas caenipelagi]NOU52374.1 3-deoxy-D-manno-octulosonic acid kinase [Pseudoalteromonas caenipelagi]
MNITKINSHYLLSNEKTTSDVFLDWFDPTHWQQLNAIVATKKGRATAWFYKHNEHVNVLKHYWRGGLVGKLLSDQYFFYGLKKTRVYKEFELLCALDNLGLPVPKPVAAKVSVQGLIYRGDLITSAINGATSLCERLQISQATEQELSLVGRTIAQFHNQGVYHADLNINNILFGDDGKVYLIDFDRGQLRPQQAAWQRANMERLHRSFKKEAGKWPTFNFSELDWQTLLSAYQATIR